MEGIYAGHPLHPQLAALPSRHSSNQDDNEMNNLKTVLFRLLQLKQTTRFVAMDGACSSSCYFSAAAAASPLIMTNEKRVKIKSE